MKEMRSNPSTWIRMALAALLGLLSSPAMAQLSCGNVYATNIAGQIYLTANNGTQTLVGNVSGLPGTVNPFGISADGSRIYLAAQGFTAGTSGRVSVVNASTFGVITTSAAPALQSGQGGFNAGAVNPVNGWFYFSAPNQDGSGATGHHLYAFNPSTPTVAPVRVGQISGTAGNNGDLTFDSQGNLYLLSGNASNTPIRNRIYRVGQVPTSAGTGSLPATELAIVPSGSTENVGGIAFNAAGELMTSIQGNVIRRYNPLTGAEIGSATATAGVVNDLASCAGGNTITLRKDLPQGRVVAGNQFTLQLSGGGLTTTQTATTTGSATGVQPQVVGPLLAIDGATFSINEAAAGSPATVLANYGRSWQCVDAANGNASVASGTTFAGSVTMPSSGTGASVVCTIINARSPILRLQKALPNGRSVAGNQFLLRIAGGSGADVTATTTGATNTPTQVATLDPAMAGTAYTLSESAAGSPATVLSNYTPTYDCTNTRSGGQTPSGSGTSFTVTPVAGDDLTCTFTNALPARVTIQKISVGGTGNFSFTGTNGIASQTLTTATAGTAVSGAVQTLAAASTATTITESAPPAGYSLTAASCTGLPSGGTATPNLSTRTLTLNAAATAPGANVVCTFTNTRATTLTLVKTVTNDNGGTQAATAWTLSATGPTNISGVTGNAAVTNAVVNPGTYALSESATPTGYVASLYNCVRNGGAAVAGNSITLAAGDTVTCTINNNDSNQTDISITKSASPGTVASGGQVAFTLVVRNLGVAVAHGAVVRDPAVAGLDCTAAGLPAPTCSATGGASCPASLTASGLQAGVAIPTLPNGGFVTIGLTCNVTASGF